MSLTSGATSAQDARKTLRSRATHCLSLLLRPTLTAGMAVPAAADALDRRRAEAAMVLANLHLR